jgi:hypothetical protein
LITCPLQPEALFPCLLFLPGFIQLSNVTKTLLLLVICLPLLVGRYQLERELILAVTIGRPELPLNPQPAPVPDTIICSLLKFPIAITLDSHCYNLAFILSPFIEACPLGLTIQPDVLGDLPGNKTPLAKSSFDVGKHPLAALGSSARPESISITAPGKCYGVFESPPWATAA